MPPIFTIFIAKSLLKVSRLVGGGGGSALPGLVAEKLNPNIGHQLAARLSHGSIIVTGTNGKTTTSKMIAQILTDSGEDLVANRAGSNLSRGVVSALIEHANWRGGFSQSMGLFEVDEAAMPAVCAMIQPKAILVLNLFRDQLDRYGELDSTAGLIGKGIAATTAEVYLNADDPLVASLSRYANISKVHYFGIEDVPTAKLAHDVTADSNNCPICGRALIYTANYFGHIGHYKCKEGHFDRPAPDYAARKIALDDGRGSALMTLPDAHEKQLSITVNLPGLYNIYNAVAAAAITSGWGVAPSSVAQSIEQVKAAFGRVEKLEIKGRTIYLLLVKNPTGFNQVIQTFLLQKKQQNVLICINDNFADGRDVSWLWDVAFEELKIYEPNIAVTGIRATDMALRLKYADIPTGNVESDLKKALNQFVTQLPAGGTGYIIPTYTAMLAARKQLGKLTKLKGVWK